MRNPIFGRLVTAMVTPFTADDTVNLNEAVRLAKYLVENGTETILVAGTTGESPTLSHDEEFQLFNLIKSATKGKAQVMAGTGSNCTKTAIASTQKAEKLKVDGTLQVVPYYNKPSQEGLFQHFKTIAENTKLSILLYNIPGRTGCNMEPETVARLAQINNIVGIKEAAGSVEQVAKIRKLCPDDFDIYSGDDANTLNFMEKGAQGLVSVSSHCAGRGIVQMIQAFLDGDQAKARQIESRLMPLFKVLFINTNPAPVKAALNMMGFEVGSPRLPVVSVTDEEKSRIRKVLKSLGLV